MKTATVTCSRKLAWQMLRQVQTPLWGSKKHQLVSMMVYLYMTSMRMTLIIDCRRRMRTFLRGKLAKTQLSSIQEKLRVILDLRKSSIYLKLAPFNRRHDRMKTDRLKK